VALTLDRLGHDDDAAEVVHAHIRRLEELVDDPDGVDLALWNRELARGL